MKKTVILILAVLPIVLLVTIAFAGRIFKEFQRIDVTAVQFVFVDKYNNPYEETSIKINCGETQKTAVTIEPSDATEKRFSYAVADDTVCTIDENGVITALKVGDTEITVTTRNGRFVASLKVQVVDDAVKGITLEPSEMDLIIGDSYTLKPTVLSADALNKVVTYESSDPTIVTVDVNGNLKALKEGDATITATTEEGGFTATCTVHAIQGTPALSLNIEGATDIAKPKDVYRVSVEKIDLREYLVVDPERVNIEDVRFLVDDGYTVGPEEEESLGILTFDTANNAIFTVTIYVGDPQTPDYSLSIGIRYIPT